MPDIVKRASMQFGGGFSGFLRAEATVCAFSSGHVHLDFNSGHAVRCGVVMNAAEIRELAAHMIACADAIERQPVAEAG